MPMRLVRRLKPILGVVFILIENGTKVQRHKGKNVMQVVQDLQDYFGQLQGLYFLLSFSFSLIL
jgi:predicted component of viral defense system (DUF524 family)